jgi:hypothetical protein
VQCVHLRANSSDMKLDQLRSIGHNIADSLASGSSLLFNFFEGPRLSVFGAARHSPEHRVVVDFLNGQATFGKVPPLLARVIADSPNALAHLCKKHGASPSMFRELVASYSIDSPGKFRFAVMVEDNRGRRALDEYVGVPGKRIRTRDYQGRVHRKRGYVSNRQAQDAPESSIQLPGPPRHGPPESYFHCVWIDAAEHEPVEWYDELDASRWSVRCVRKYRDGRLEAHSYASDDWRDAMPESPIPPLAIINHDSQFSAKEISKSEFEVAWNQANRSKVR